MAKAIKTKRPVQRAEAVKTARRAVLYKAEEGESVPVVQLATRVPKGLYRRLKLYAVGNTVSISDLVTEAIRDLLVKRGEKLQKAS
jgi:hypothetical protein